MHKPKSWDQVWPSGRWRLRSVAFGSAEGLEDPEGGTFRTCPAQHPCLAKARSPCCWNRPRPSPSQASFALRDLNFWAKCTPGFQKSSTLYLYENPWGQAENYTCNMSRSLPCWNCGTCTGMNHGFNYIQSILLPNTLDAKISSSLMIVQSFAKLHATVWLGYRTSFLPHKCQLGSMLHHAFGSWNVMCVYWQMLALPRYVSIFIISYHISRPGDRPYSCTLNRAWSIFNRHLIFPWSKEHQQSCGAFRH